MKLTAYSQLIQLSKDKVREALAIPRAYEMKMKANLQIAELKSKMVTQEQSIQEIASVYPIDFPKLLDAMDELDLLQRREKQYNDVIGQMFPDDAPAA